MTTILIIYLSGVLFFLSQAIIYSRLSGARVRGAAAWPLLALVIPQWWMGYKALREHAENGLRHNERVRPKAMTLGDEGCRFMWGIGK